MQIIFVVQSPEITSESSPSIIKCHERVSHPINNLSRKVKRSVLFDRIETLRQIKCLTQSIAGTITGNSSMQANGLRGRGFHSKKSGTFRGDVFVLSSNFIPGVGIVREDFILVILLLRFGAMA